MVERICPKCGASNKDKEFKGNFCIDCYIEMNLPKLPEKITVYICRECGATKVRSWEDVDIESAMESLLKDKKMGKPHVRLEDKYAIIKYPEINREFKVRVKEKKSLCDQCARRVSGYYEAIIQVRDSYYNEKFIEKLLKNLEKATFISKIVEEKKGIDIYVGDKMIARSILSALKVKPKVTHTLYGVKDGKRVYRTTFLIRDKKLP